MEPDEEQQAGPGGILAAIAAASEKMDAQTIGVTLVVDGAVLSGVVTSFENYLRGIAAAIEKNKPGETSCRK